MNWYLNFRLEDEYIEVVESMHPSQFQVGGLLPYHDEGWILVGKASIAKEGYLNPIPVRAIYA
jgi:hypothetical protein